MQTNFLFSIRLDGSGLWLGFFGCPNYRAATAMCPARGKIQLRLMSCPTGGIHQTHVWPRRTLRATAALDFIDCVKGGWFEGMSRAEICRWIENRTSMWYGRARV
jgi:hypothetical protein